MVVLNYKGVTDIDNEYIIFIKNEIYRIYAPNEHQAINRFKTACLKYRFTENKGYQEYWDMLMNAADDKDFIIMQNTDFYGIRKIV